MKLKFSIQLLVALLVMVTFACDPLEDVYKELDQAEINANGALGIVSADLAFTLTEEDYDSLEDVSGAGANAAEFHSFRSEDDAKTLIPTILDIRYPHLGNGSRAAITYDLYLGSQSDVATYTGATVYAVSDANYEALGGDAETYNLFNALQPAGAYIPGILDDSIASPTDGDVVLVTYDYADEVVDPSIDHTMRAADYQMLIDYVIGSRDSSWLHPVHLNQELYYGAVTRFENFEGRASEHKEWINDYGLADTLFNGSTTPEEDSIRVQRRIEEGVIKYLELAYPNAVPQINGIDVLYYLTYDVWYGSSIGGKEYHASLQADGNGSFDFVDEPTTSALSSSSASEQRGDFYVYDNGDWELDRGAVYLSSADYESMGNPGPGRYGNFSSSVSPDDYLPQLLLRKFPYAQAADEIVVVYKYYSGGPQTRGDHYTFENAVWNEYNPVISQTTNFAHDGNSWVADNTIKYTLTSADYDFIANNTAGTAWGDNLGRFGNFNRTGGSTSWSDENLIAALSDLLNNLYPDAEEGQKYLMIFDTYIGTSSTEEKHLIKVNGVYELFTGD